MGELSLAILAKGFISPLLIETLAEHKIPFLPQNKKVIEKLRSCAGNLNILDEEEAIKLLLNRNTPIYTNAEDALPFLLKNSPDPSLVDNIRLFKNKLLMRLFLNKIYSDFYFLAVDKEELKHIDLPAGGTYIIKPSIGFLSIGIRKIRTKEDLHSVIDEIFSETKKYSNTFPSSVINTDKFLIEEYIVGEEFACDAYFNSEGQAVILGIYSHPFLNEDDFRDVVYYTSSSIMHEMLPKVEEFFHSIASFKKIINFPVHIEFRLRKNMLVPIEVNPMRFGGFGLANLPYYAFGINSYEHYFLGKKPDWDKILEKRKDEIFTFVLGRVPEKLSGDKKPDHEKFKGTFKDLIDYYELDYKKYPAFAIAFGKTDDLSEALKYLGFDFDEYFY